ncbi:MAG: hypothetical protein KGY41_10645, partial [Desulfovermiculus sp.]|nr:hypothetical protein [Desulfovermiculus sp.]
CTCPCPSRPLRIARCHPGNSGIARRLPGPSLDRQVPPWQPSISPKRASGPPAPLGYHPADFFV